MKLKNPTLLNEELYARVEHERMQKTLLKIVLVVAVASVVFIAMTVIAG